MNEKRYKKLKRMEMRRKRDVLPAEYCRRADAQIIRRICSLTEYKEADMVFCFVSTEKEVCTSPLIEHALNNGKRVAAPRCAGHGIMEAFEVRSFEDLEPGRFGILEPVKRCVFVRPDEIQFAVIPCLTCDLNGWRIGYGAGYYDRYLAKADFVKAVPCRHRLVSETVRHEPFDKQMDIVVTEEIVRYI